MSIREAAVAGQFYEADPVRLQGHINELLAGTESPPNARAKVLIVPHAGYIYSGKTAAQAYRCLESRRDEITRVILLGPAHRVYLDGMALPSVNSFITPLGSIKLDRSLIDKIIDSPDIVISDEAHRLEHSLEVQLPFLQTVLDEFTLLPVVVGDCDAERVAAVIDRLWGSDETLVVISSDLSHFHSYDEAREIDASTSHLILEKSSRLSGEQACGARAINGLMRSKHAQATTIELLDARNSGDTAGDKSRVVGYGSFLLH